MDEEASRELTAKRIIQARVAAGYIRQKDAADARKLPFTRQVLSLWERGKVEPSAQGLRDLHRAYDVSVDWLLGLEEPAA